MTHRTTPLPRFSTNGEPGTYTPPEAAAAFCDNRVRILYGRTFEPACTTGGGNWRECGACAAKPGRPAVVVVAPQGSGKTRYADLIASRLGCTVIADAWSGHDLVPPGTLALTCTPLDQRSLRGELELFAENQSALEAFVTGQRAPL